MHYNPIKPSILVMSVRLGHVVALLKLRQSQDKLRWSFGHSVDKLRWSFGHSVDKLRWSFGHSVDKLRWSFGHSQDMHTKPKTCVQLHGSAWRGSACPKELSCHTTTGG
jgi:hypothetical protein